MSWVLYRFDWIRSYATYLAADLTIDPLLGTSQFLGRFLFATNFLGSSRRLSAFFLFLWLAINMCSWRSFLSVFRFFPFVCMVFGVLIGRCWCALQLVVLAVVLLVALFQPVMRLFLVCLVYTFLIESDCSVLKYVVFPSVLDPDEARRRQQ
jgi:hypothetical protein